MMDALLAEHIIMVATEEVFVFVAVTVWDLASRRSHDDFLHFPVHFWMIDHVIENEGHF